MNLSLDELGRIAPWLRAQGDRAVEVLFRTEEFFGDKGQFRQLTLYDALGFAAFLAILKCIVDIPIDAAVLKIDPLSPTVQAVSIILLLLSATVVGIGLFVAARLMRIGTDIATSMKAAYCLFAFLIIIEILIYPLRASWRAELVALERMPMPLEQVWELLSSVSIGFWLFALLSVVLTIWRLMRWTSAIRALHAVATWRALVVVLLAEAMTAYVQTTVLNPLARQATEQAVGAI